MKRPIIYSLLVVIALAGVISLPLYSQTEQTITDKILSLENQVVNLEQRVARLETCLAVSVKAEEMVRLTKAEVMDKLAVGMSHSEVRALLGKPDSIWKAQVAAYEKWFYHFWGETQIITFARKRVLGWEGL